MSIVVADPPSVERVPVAGTSRAATVRSKSIVRRAHTLAAAVAMVLAWTITLSIGTSYRWTTVLGVASVVTCATVIVAWWRNHRHPYVGSISAVTSHHVLTSCALVAVGASLVDRLQPAPLTVWICGAVLAFVFAMIARSVVERVDFGSSPDQPRGERVAVVADDRNAAHILDLIDDHDSGWRAAVLVGPCRSLALSRGLTWGGPAGGLVEAALEHDATSVVVSAALLHRDDVRVELAALRDLGVEVHVDAGLEGFDYRRVRVAPLGHNSFLSLESTHLPRCQRLAKRAVDVALSAVLIVLLSPVLLVAAAAVKLGDGGPVLFRQDRVGERGTTFRMVKFRTMRVDAEERLAEVRHLNERDGGPLFKLSKDPRVTPVGRVLRATSIDELPQLFQVLRGTMSLVGPRPALPSEVAVFDDRLAHRHDVKPGITGLWQVEERDSISFNSYRRLDLFYVENWSLLLDFAILVHTVPAVVGRGWKAVRGQTARSEGLVAS